MTLVQARIPDALARQADEDAAALGLASRSAAVREGLRLLHRRAVEAALARDYDTFYGNAEAPSGELAAAGEQIAAETIAEREANDR